jgi:hypothetical protein
VLSEGAPVISTIARNTMPDLQRKTTSNHSPIVSHFQLLIFQLFISKRLLDEETLKMPNLLLSSQLERLTTWTRLRRHATTFTTNNLVNERTMIRLLLHYRCKCSQWDVFKSLKSRSAAKNPKNQQQFSSAPIAR